MRVLRWVAGSFTRQQLHSLVWCAFVFAGIGAFLAGVIAGS